MPISSDDFISQKSYLEVNVFMGEKMLKSAHNSNIIQSFMTTFDALSEPWGIKDNKSRHIYMNKAARMYTCTPTSFDVNGKFDHEFPTSWAEMAEGFEEHDRKTVSAGERVAVIETDFWYGNDEMEPYFSEKFPIYDNDTNCIGTIWNARKVKVISTLTFIGKEKPGVLQVGTGCENFNENEMDIIFLLMRRHSHKEIGNILGIAAKTVANRIQLMYEKSGVHNSRQFEEFCRTLNLESYLPKKMVSKGIRFV